MSLPTSDWQFWATTAVFAGAVLWLIRGLLPIPALRRRRRRRAGSRRAILTVGGKPVPK